MTSILKTLSALLFAVALVQAQPAEGKEAAAQVVGLEVTSEGFVPAQVTVKANHPIKLVVTRKTDRTCAKEIVIKDFAINKPLPLNQAVEISFTPKKQGKVRFACGMDMISGIVVVE